MGSCHPNGMDRGIGGHDSAGMGTSTSTIHGHAAIYPSHPHQSSHQDMTMSQDQAHPPEAHEQASRHYLTRRGQSATPCAHPPPSGTGGPHHGPAITQPTRGHDRRSGGGIKTQEAPPRVDFQPAEWYREESSGVPVSRFVPIGGGWWWRGSDPIAWWREGEGNCVGSCSGVYVVTGRPWQADRGLRRPTGPFTGSCGPGGL